MSVIEPQHEHSGKYPLTVRRLGVHSQHEMIVFMRTDCPACRSEGLSARAQVLLKAAGREVVATLYQVSSALLGADEAGLSEAAYQRLGANEGDMLTVHHAEPTESLSKVRSRIYGNRLDGASLRSIIGDIADGRYSDVHLAAFLTACAASPLSFRETLELTRGMVDVGERFSWPDAIVADKHSVGGLPGNRTTPIVVAIVAAHGLTIPKTSSRAITSPAGTADSMETLAPVELDVASIRRVVEQESGCVVWGGAVRLSPADDILIRVERALDIDTEGQLIASVLSKKVAAGATHLVIDMPVGPTAKVRTAEAAAALSGRLSKTAAAFGIHATIVPGDGHQPIGRGIGPALEARDVLAVLQGSGGAPEDLRARACALAGALLEIGGRAATASGPRLADKTLTDGHAWAKFQRICEAQGGMRVPGTAEQRHELLADRDGIIRKIDNRKLSRLAKLAGAPDAKSAGVEMHIRLGDVVSSGEPLCSVHTESRGELAYALSYSAAHPDLFEIGAR